MRRKSFDVLFETRAGMAYLAQNPTLWRSLFYYVISVGAFVGVCTNIMFAQQYITVRIAILLAILIKCIIGMCIFGFFLHGLIDACGGGSGNVKGLLCILGFTGLPFLVLTPLSLLAARLGGMGIIVFPVALFIGCLWSLYLIIRAVEAVYLIKLKDSCAIVGFGILLWLIMLLLPIYLTIKVILLSIF